ncbi:MAG: ATP-dependent DNA helicase PcrA [Candidatus Paraimprobicoccus trichonymphae]|uniref:DNA 3'-5' helicase n=1 Tax=Candidatus Paraimprobicoccus trichonymphae TaxID=3033793 RepID=A0AA48I3K0_9FIRM|nr:MAG: ATP-dependent DNA helicase PcrA [Candidatus Paraimprobicoccus trichonymphae]
MFNIKGPLIILAGAGSGKTTVIINRIFYMVNYGDAYSGKESSNDITKEMIEKFKESEECLDEYLKSKITVKPWNILAITFTNKAANELKERLSKKLGENSQSIWASTFHSMCVRILRLHADKIGYTQGFTIYDSEDSKKLVRDCCKIIKVDDKLLPYKTVMGEISRAKNELKSVIEFKIFVHNDFRMSKISEVYGLYQKTLEESDGMDFDDLINNTVKLFENYPDILETYQSKFKYILVDEYQDTNHSQDYLVNLLAKRHNNLCVVGDDDQSIYKFRGATIDNMLNFDKKYRNTSIIKLEQNYRSTKNILSAANTLIGYNIHRKIKKLWTEKEIGAKIRIHTAFNEYEEANFIADMMKKYIEEGGNAYSDFAVLYRMNSQSNVLERVFVKNNIPYRMLGGVRFYERKEIKDIIAYLSVINNPSDSVRLRRIINIPKRAIGDRVVNLAVEVAIEKNLSLLEVLAKAEDYDCLKKSSTKVEGFVSLIKNLINIKKSGKLKLSKLYESILNDTEYIKYLESYGDDPRARVENVKELSSNIIKYEEENGEEANLSGFLEEVSLLSDTDNYNENVDAVSMMTMHAAKGLEFKNVFLPGFEEGIFPRFQAIYKPEDIEEERRLAYVAITRAKENLYILNSNSRMIFGCTSNYKPSRFIKELSSELVEKTKSKDWKKLNPEEDEPRSAYELQLKSTISARKFNKITGGITTEPGNNFRNNLEFGVGDKVKHALFGEGEVVDILDSNGTILVIDFLKVGIKKLAPQFLSKLSLDSNSSLSAQKNRDFCARLVRKY